MDQQSLAKICHGIAFSCVCPKGIYMQACKQNLILGLTGMLKSGSKQVGSNTSKPTKSVPMAFVPNITELIANAKEVT